MPLRAIPSDIKNYTWIIGGTTVTNTTGNINHSFGTYGSYDVSSDVVDINGCTSTKTIANYITVNGPVANFSSGPGNCINKQVDFNDSVCNTMVFRSQNGPGILEMALSRHITSPPFSHAYSQTGNYGVSLTREK